MKNKKSSNVKKLTGMSGVGLKLQGDGLRMSGAGGCPMCGGGNDKFLFENQAL